MSHLIIRFGGHRTLVIATDGAAAERKLPEPFVVLLPAYNAAERHRAETSITALLRLGCVEICCIGPEAEVLHDALDAIIETEGVLDVATTWIEEESEGCDYFLHAAAGGCTDLLAYVEGHPSLQVRLVSGTAVAPSDPTQDMFEEE